MAAWLHMALVAAATAATGFFAIILHEGGSLAAAVGVALLAIAVILGWSALNRAKLTRLAQARTADEQRDAWGALLWRRRRRRR